MAKTTASNERSSDRCDACESCDGGRRVFLTEAMWIVSAAIVGLGGSEGQARAFPAVFARGAGGGDDLRTYPIPSADGATIDHDNQVIVVRFAGRAYAFLLSCPHQNTALRWLPADGRFQCPRHESKYKPDGEFISGRATRNMDRFALRKEGNTLIVDLSKWYRSDTQAAEWEAASVVV